VSLSSSILAEKAMLVHLSISVWTGKRLDRRITKEIADRAGIWQVKPEQAGRYTKCLIPQQAESLENVKKAANAIRTFHYEQTLPWAQEGARILPSANYMEYSGTMRQLRVAFDEAVRVFLVEYPNLKESARQVLNGNYRDEDYPTPEKLRRKFKVNVEPTPFPSAEDFRVEIADQHAEVIRGQIESQVQDAVSDAMTDLWQRLYSAVMRMTERLSDPKKIFRDSLVGNLRELVELLPRLNLTGDAQLEELRRQVEERLAVHEPQTLRDNRGMRRQVADAAREIANSMQAYMGPIGDDSTDSADQLEVA
jgi:hypothetical protein